MPSQTRQDCTDAVIRFTRAIHVAHREWSSPAKLLMVGIAGDPLPKGEYSPLFSSGCDITTLDIDPRWKPDVVADITKTPFSADSWDVVVIVQVIEHIRNLWDLPKELHRIVKPEGFVIVDCPWQYPYHAEPPSFMDYWRISVDGMQELFKAFQLVDRYATNSNTSCLLRKPNV